MQEGLYVVYNDKADHNPPKEEGKQKQNNSSYPLSY